jgi:hypothetical protein
MLRTLALSASVIAFAGGLALAEAPMTREPSTGRSVATSSLSTLKASTRDGKDWLVLNRTKDELKEGSRRQ